MSRNVQISLFSGLVAVAVGITVWVGSASDSPRSGYSLPGVDPAPAVEAWESEVELAAAETLPTLPITTSSEPDDPTPTSTEPVKPVTTAVVPAAGFDPAGSLDQSAFLLRESIRKGSPEWVGVMTSTGSDEEIDDFALAIGRQPDIVQIAIGWETDGFDAGLMDRVSARGSVLMVSWEPWDHRQKVAPAEQPKFALSNILSGQFDGYIDEWANGLAADGRPVLLRFAHEMNGDWYPWNEKANGNADGSYVEAWRYVRSRFLAAGAKNVIWVWSPNVIYPGSLPLEPLYPGESEVDLVGLVGYFGHFNRIPDEFPRFGELFGGTLDTISTFDSSPVLITETSSTEEGGYKAGWVADFLSEVGERDDVVGFVWFDVLKESDWTVDSSPEALAAFLSGISDPAYSG